MRLIDTEERARRFARVILSDIELYNRQPVRSPAEVEPQLYEGYVYFRSRVTPALVPLFSQAIADRWSSAPTKPAADPAGARPGNLR